MVAVVFFLGRLVHHRRLRGVDCSRGCLGRAVEKFLLGQYRRQQRLQESCRPSRPPIAQQPHTAGTTVRVLLRSVRRAAWPDVSVR